MNWYKAVVLLGSLAALSAQGRDEARNKGVPRIGQTAEQVKEHWGAPQRISRQVWQLRCQEQWHYGMPRPMRVVFDCPRGEKGRVVRASQGGR